MTLKNIKLISIIDPVACMLAIILQLQVPVEISEMSESRNWHEVVQGGIDASTAEDKGKLPDDQLALENELFKQLWNHAPDQVEKEHTAERFGTFRGKIAIRYSCEIAVHTEWVQWVRS